MDFVSSDETGQGGERQIQVPQVLCLEQSAPLAKSLRKLRNMPVQSANMSYTRPENPTPPTVTEGQKRKRGRPKKQPQADTVEPLAEKKPRGRPKGSKKTTPVTVETVKPPAGKRGRGRPRKWPQAVVQEGEPQEENSQGSSDSNLNSAPGKQGLKLGITGKDGSRSGKTAGLKRSPSTFSATAE